MSAETEAVKTVAGLMALAATDRTGKP